MKDLGEQAKKSEGERGKKEERGEKVTPEGKPGFLLLFLFLLLIQFHFIFHSHPLFFLPSFRCFPTKRERERGKRERERILSHKNFFSGKQKGRKRTHRRKIYGWWEMTKEWRREGDKNFTWLRKKEERKRERSRENRWEKRWQITKQAKRRFLPKRKREKFLRRRQR